MTELLFLLVTLLPPSFQHLAALRQTAPCFFTIFLPSSLHLLTVGKDIHPFGVKNMDHGVRGNWQSEVD